MNNAERLKHSLQFVTNPGQAEQEIYHGELMPDNSIKLIFDGYQNIQDYIESFRESSEIENIIRRVNNGELDLLNQRSGVFGDFVGLPNSRSEMLNTVINAQKFFDSLPENIRSQYHDSFDEWFSHVSDDDFLVKTGLLKKVTADKEAASAADEVTE